MVNPKYVTSIKQIVHRTSLESKKMTVVWVVGNSGYGTYEVRLKDHVARLIKLKLEGDEDE